MTASSVMENRFVALAVLENLFYWPPSPRANSSSGSGSFSGSATEINTEDAIEASVANGGDDAHREPRQRRADHCRAVLQLPHLCLKLGKRWVSSEVVPYLLRCIEEEDPQLALVSGVALLGVVRPRKQPWGRTAPASADSSPQQQPQNNGESEAEKESNGAADSYLSLDNAQPVCVAMATSSIREVRCFTAEVVVPHLIFGVALYRSTTLDSWDLKYVPASVLSSDAALSHAGSQGGGDDDDDQAEWSDMTTTTAAVSSAAAAAAVAAEETATLRAAVQRQLYSSLSECSLSLPSCSSLSTASVPISAATATAAAAATRQRCLELAQEDEHLQLLFNDSYASLAGPLLFDAALAPFADLSSCGGAGTFHSFRRRGGRRGCATPPLGQTPLHRADLGLYGASYARNTAAANEKGRDDYFSINVQARALMHDLVDWMDLLEPFSGEDRDDDGRPPMASSPQHRDPHPTPTQGGNAGGGGGSRPQRLHLGHYFYAKVRREAFRWRWRYALRLMASLLESPYPGAAAVAVRLIAALLHAIQQYLMDAEVVIASTAAAAATTTAAPSPRMTLHATTSALDHRLWTIGLPAAPMLTTAALQAFHCEAAQRHVVFCIAAAVSLRRLPPPSVVLPDQVARLLQTALTSAQATLLDLLHQQHFVMTANRQVSVVFGTGPMESRAARLDTWDICFTTDHGAAASGTGAPATTTAQRLPDDSFLVLDSSSRVGHAAARRAAAAMARSAVNTASAFRLHRLVCHAFLASLPLCLDFVATIGSHHRDGSAVGGDELAAPASPPLCIDVVCRLLLQIIVPPAALVNFMTKSSGSPVEVEVSSIQLESSASLHHGTTEVVLEAVERVFSEVALHLPPLLAAAVRDTATMHRVVDTTYNHLLLVFEACLHFIPQYASWKARWLVAKQLPRLAVCFFSCLLGLAPYSSKSSTARDAATSCAGEALLLQTMELLIAAFQPSGDTSTNRNPASGDEAEWRHRCPMRDLVVRAEEEMEVRCIAVQSAAMVVQQTAIMVLRMATTDGHSGRAAGVFISRDVMAALDRLISSVSGIVLTAADDAAPRVRCKAAEAVSCLCRVLSLLSSVAGRWLGSAATVTEGVQPRGQRWAALLRANTDVLVRLMKDDHPTVQLALVAQLTDLLLLRLPSVVEAGGGGGGEVSLHQCIGHEILLDCLHRLSSHELWRLRERYAVLLARMCGRLLLSGGARGIRRRRSSRRLLQKKGVGAASPTLGGISGGMASSVSPSSAAAGAGAMVGVQKDCEEEEEESINAAAQAHNHPLYQLARTELVSLLVRILFDKVRSVRDTALEAVEELCLHLASCHLDDSVGGDAGASPGRNGFVDDVLWPRIEEYEPAWANYLSRSAVLRTALRLRVDKTAVFIPLLDQLARDPVLNVRLVVAKVILEVLLRTAPAVDDGGSLSSHEAAEATFALPPQSSTAANDQTDVLLRRSLSFGRSGKARQGAALPSGTIAYCILMNKPTSSASSSPSLLQQTDAGLPPPLTFSAAERAGVILEILRLLLKDACADVRDEAAKALKICF